MNWLSAFFKGIIDALAHWADPHTAHAAGQTWGYLLLIGIIVVLIICVIAFFIWIWRRAKAKASKTP